MSTLRWPAAALVAASVLLSGCSGGGSSSSKPSAPKSGAASSSSSSSGGGRATVVFAPEHQVGDGVLRIAADRVERRAHALHIDGVRVVTDGGKITVTAPGGQDVAGEIEGLGQPAVLEFRPVLATAAPGSSTATGTVPADLKQSFASASCGGGAVVSAPPPSADAVLCDGGGQEGKHATAKYALGPSRLDGDGVQRAAAQLDKQFASGWQVELEFTTSGSAKFADVTQDLATQQSPNNQFAITLDGSVISAPAVREAITGGKAVISGNFTQKSATNLAALITSGSLPVPLETQEKSVVGG
jgi:preprotein translocase subunit SecD